MRRGVDIHIFLFINNKIINQVDITINLNKYLNKKCHGSTFVGVVQLDKQLKVEFSEENGNYQESAIAFIISTKGVFSFLNTFW